MSRALAKFLTSGIITFLVDYSVSVGIHYFLTVPDYLASPIGFLAGFIVNYSLNKKWVFRGAEKGRYKTKIQFVLFVLLTLFNLVASSLFVVLAAKIGIQIEVSKIIISVIIAGWNFFINQKFIFAKSA